MFVTFGKNLAEDGAGLADFFGEGAGIDAGDGGNVVFF